MYVSQTALSLEKTSKQFKQLLEPQAAAGRFRGLEVLACSLL